jgi:PKD repeat protein
MQVLTRSLWAAATGLALVAGGCGLKEVNAPGLSGPAELAVSLRLTVNPDVLTADGYSTAMVQAEVRGIDGSPLAGRDIYFALADESGRWADLGTLSYNRQITDSAGLAQVIYTAPPRTDATGNQTLLVAGRTVGNDASGQVYRTVRLELRSAEPRLFPQNPSNKAPTCQFTVEAPDGMLVGKDILFQSTSYDSDGTIVRYAWDFGDGGRDDKPDVNHSYHLALNYTVTHKVWDDDGWDKVCTQTLQIR